MCFKQNTFYLLNIQHNMLGNKLNTECDLCSTTLGGVLVKTQCFDKTPLCVFKVCLVYVLRL